MRTHPGSWKPDRVTACDQVLVEDLSLPAGPAGRVMVRIFRADHAPRPAPVVLYLGDATPATRADRPGKRCDHHLRLIASGARAAVLVPRSDVGRSSHELEPLFAILCWIVEEGQRRSLDGTRVALAGEGSGAKMCSRLAVLAQEHALMGICAGSLLWDPERDPLAWGDAARFLGRVLRGTA